MPRPKLFRTFALLVTLLPICLFMLSGCGGDDPTSGKGVASGGKGGGSHTPGVLRYPITAEPTTLDPAIVSDGYTIDLLQNIYMGMVGWDEKNNIVGLAAEKWDVSKDGKVYTFTLRDNVKFHNGRTVTADDVVYSISRSLDPRLNSPVAITYLNDIQGATEYFKGKAKSLVGIKAINPKTVQITLVAPRPYFLGKLTYGTAYILAKEVVEQGDKNEQGAYTVTEKNVCGIGPFKLENYTRQSKVTLAAFTDFYGGTPKLTKIERPIILDSKTARNRYDTGELEYTVLEKGDYEKDKDNAALKPEIKIWNRSATWYLGLNQTNYAPFKDKRVRQAIAYAIDKDAIIKGVLLGINKKAEGILPEGVLGYDPDFKGLPYDPEKAKKLLADAGFPGGKGLPPLKLAFRESQPDLRKTAEVVKEQLAQVGVTIDLSELEWGRFLKDTDARKVDFFHMRWSADYLDPQNFLSVLLQSDAEENRTAYKNAAYDALTKKADAETDPQKRLAMYHQAERMVVDDAPWVPIYFQRDLELMKPYVSGIRDGLLGHLPHTTTVVN